MWDLTETKEEGIQEFTSGTVVIYKFKNISYIPNMYFGTFSSEIKITDFYKTFKEINSLLRDFLQEQCVDDNVNTPKRFMTSRKDIRKESLETFIKLIYLMYPDTSRDLIVPKVVIHY